MAEYKDVPGKDGRPRRRRTSSGVGDDIAESAVSLGDLAGGPIGAGFDTVRRRSNDVNEQVEGKTRVRKYR